MARKLLIADDSVTIQKVVNLTFADENITIDTAANGGEAIEKARSLKPDIVLADVFMPAPNGYEVCAALKADPELASIPVVLLVGAFEPFDESEAARVGCDAFLTKPFDTSELVQTVHSLIARGSQKPKAKAAGESASSQAPAGAVVPGVRPVSSRTRESFLGSNRILDLDLLGAAALAVGASAGPLPAVPSQSSTLSGSADDVALPANRSEPTGSQVIPFPGAREGPPPAFSEDTLNAIAQKVARLISPEIVREVAWEVVPEMAEIMIRECLGEQGLPGKK